MCNICFRSFAILLYRYLSCGALVSCHLLRAFRFSTFLFYEYRAFFRSGSFLSGVACHAAFWIILVMFATASSMSISVFMGNIGVICSSRVPLKQFKSVVLLYSDGFLGLPSMRVNAVIRMGV